MSSSPLKTASSKNILVIGASSAIAQAACRIWACQGHGLFLTCRDGARLQTLCADLSIRGASRCEGTVLDVNDLNKHEETLEMAFRTLGPPDVVLIAHGTLGNPARSESDFSEALADIRTNAISVMSLLTLLANRMEARGEGSIAVITSVAGVRGRRSNYVYGAAKAAVSTFLSGLSQRLSSKGIQVLDVRPGFVDTPMTREMEKGLLWSKPERVAEDICHALARKCSGVLYTPWFWQAIMLVIRHIPNWIFRRMKL